jgi:hypothetical protein
MSWTITSRNPGIDGDEFLGSFFIRLGWRASVDRPFIQAEAASPLGLVRTLGLIMEKFAVTALLLMALALPVGIFWLLRSRSRFNGPLAAAIAVATGWALNVAWAFASQGSAANGPSQANADTFSIAMRFGWACPAVLVLLTWLVWRFKTRRAT